MMFAVPSIPGESGDPGIPDIIFVLHTDHEQKRLNLQRPSGRFFRLPIRLPVICCRYRVTVGPAHGGANEACLKMLQEIGSIGSYPALLRADKDDPFCRQWFWSPRIPQL